MKRLIALLAITLVITAALPLGASLPAAKAQATAPGLPQGFTVLPPDFDRSDDEIVQLNNLTIRGLSSGSVPATIYASRDYNDNCIKYYSTSGSGVAYPCPLSMAPSVLYQIQVDHDTILLLRNRARASFSNFAIGDRINVYGFFDSGSQYMQALIVRDLDKPSVGQEGRYVQLNNVMIISDPSSPFAPATFVIADGGSPCWYYSGPTGYRTSISACPMPAASFSMPPVAPNLLPYPTARIYTVQVTGATRLLDFSRIPLPLSEFRMGDSINIFGRYNPSTNTIEALILRDLGPRIEPPPPAAASLTVTVTNRVQCFTTPCNPVPEAGAKVELRSQTGSATTQATDSAGRTYFTGLLAGTYQVTAYGSNRTAGSQVTLSSGEQRQISLELGGVAPSGVQLSSVTPSFARRGETVTLSGSGFTSINNTIYMNGQRMADLASADGRTIVYSNVGYPAWYCPPSLYCATVQPAPLPPGTYQMSVVNANGSSNSVTFALEVAGTTSFAVSTVPASAIGRGTATLRGSITPKEFGGSYWFEYGTSAGALSRRTLEQLWSGFPTVEASQFISELSPGTTYYYRLVAKANSGATASGGVLSFTTSY